MKTFIASLISFLFIISSVTIYILLLDSTTYEFHMQIDKIIISAEKEDWTLAKKSFHDLAEKWSVKRIWLEAFINHSKTEQITELITEIENQIKFEDKKHIIIDADKLKLIFMNIYKDELPTLENII